MTDTGNNPGFVILCKKIISMKKFLFGLFLFALTGSAGAQVLNPVLWTFSSKKITEKVYEVSLTANMQNSWHLYSQTQPADAINMPTGIIFKKNPFIILDGKIKELGKMEVYKDTRLGISAYQYTGKVEFVQKLKLKSNVKTNISGSVEYQTCDDKKCLPPKKINFSVAIT